MFFKPKPTVTPDDRHWIEDAFAFFEEEFGRAYLKNAPTILPTKEFFSIEFKGTRDNAKEILTILTGYMDIRDAKIDLHFFSDKLFELTDGISIVQHDNGRSQGGRNALGTYSEKGFQKYSIGVETELLKEPVQLISTLVHELSHLVLLGEGRLKENDEELTDLACIALGFGVFTCNSIFSFNQFRGPGRQGWQTQRRGYVPEEVATYAFALLTRYQDKDPETFIPFLNPSPKKQFEKNFRYLKETQDIILFK